MTLSGLRFLLWEIIQRVQSSQLLWSFVVTAAPNIFFGCLLTNRDPMGQVIRRRSLMQVLVLVEAYLVFSFCNNVYLRDALLFTEGCHIRSSLLQNCGCNFWIIPKGLPLENMYTITPAKIAHLWTLLLLLAKIIGRGDVFRCKNWENMFHLAKTSSGAY